MNDSHDLETADRALSFDRVRRINTERCLSLHERSGIPIESWKLGDWSNATAGELGEAAGALNALIEVLLLNNKTVEHLGEACNIVKKLKRIEDGPYHNAPEDGDADVLREQLADEFADTFLYMDLTAWRAGIDLGAAIARKFNAKSEELGVPEYKM